MIDLFIALLKPKTQGITSMERITTTKKYKFEVKSSKLHYEQWKKAGKVFDSSLNALQRLAEWKTNPKNNKYGVLNN